MAAVWTEVCTLAVVDQFAESRGRINLGLLHALARTHALLYRNSYCLVFVQVLDARLVRGRQETCEQVALHVVSLAQHRNEGHATCVMTHALTQVRDKAVHSLRTSGMTPRDGVMIARSKIVATGETLEHLVRLMRRCCTNVSEVRLHFTPEAAKKKEYFSIELLPSAWTTPCAAPSTRRSPPSRSPPSRASPSRVATRRNSMDGATPRSDAPGDASVPRGSSHGACVRSLAEYMQLQAARRRFWSNRIGEPCCCCWHECDGLRLRHGFGAVTFAMRRIDATGSVDEMDAQAKGARQLLMRGGFRAIVGAVGVDYKARKEIMDYVVEQLRRPARTNDQQVAWAAGHYYFSTDVLARADGTIALASCTTHQSELQWKYRWPLLPPPPSRPLKT